MFETVVKIAIITLSSIIEAQTQEVVFLILLITMILKACLQGKKIIRSLLRNSHIFTFR